MASATAPSPAPAHFQPPQPPARGRRLSLLLIVVTTAVVLIVAAAYLLTRSSSYEATANVLVSPLAVDDLNFQGLPLIRESSDGSRPVQTATGLLFGPQIAKLAAAGLGDGWTQSEVEAAVTVQPRGASNIVAIGAEADSAGDAARVANRYASAGLALRRRALEPELEREIEVVSGSPGDGERLARLQAAEESGDPTLSVAAQAQPPTGSASMSAKLILAIALIVGLLVGVALAMIVNVSRAPALDPPRG